jgi:hypothetical protein
MFLGHLEQGEGKDAVDLGYVWFCVNNDSASKDYCDECEDAELEQMEMEL